MSQEPRNDEEGRGNEQGRMFVGEEGGGIPGLENLVVPDKLLNDDGETTPGDYPLERAIHLLNCLNAIAAANMRIGLKKAGTHALEPDAYGGKRGAVVAGAGRNAQRLMTEAKHHFARACDLNHLLSEKPDQAGEIKSEAKTAFGRIMEDYGTDHKKLDKARRQLRKQIRSGISNEEADVITTITNLNREHKLRPYTEVAENTTSEMDEEDMKLSYRRRLEAFQFDPRAGFLPTTRLELNTAISYLDYLDNPEYPLGVTDQLFEVMTHQQKKGGGSAAEGFRAVESITWAIGDHAIDAALAIASLTSLQRMLQEGARPDLRIADVDEIETNNPALAYIIQYLDFCEFIGSGAVERLDRDPGRTNEVRFFGVDGKELQGTDSGKHKRIYSQYTRSDRTDAFNKHFDRRLRELTVKDIRYVITEIIENHERRLEFMLARLNETDEFFGVKTGQMTKGIAKAVADSEAVVAAVLAESCPQYLEAA